MSEDVKLRMLDLAAVILAAAIIVTPLSRPLVYYIRNTEPQNPNNWNHHNYQFYQTLFSGLEVIVALLTFCAIVFQACIFQRQRNLMEGQLKATEMAANAAMAAVDRPFLYVESAAESQDQIAIKKGVYIARFRIANYGKAPATVLSLQAALFVGPRPEHNGRMPVEMLPAGATIFPAEWQIRQFIREMGSQPCTTDGVIEIADDAAAVRSWTRKSQPFIIPPGKQSPVLAVSKSIHYQDVPGTISVRHLMAAHLIGWLIYKGLSDEIETVWFCYSGIENGLLVEKYGAPYNCRTKKPEEGPPTLTPWPGSAN